MFELVRAVNRCSFPDALKFIAELGGIHLGDSSRLDVRCKVAERQRQRERIDRVVDKLAELEQTLRTESRDAVHKCERVLWAPGPWSERQWDRAQAAAVLRDEYLLPAYTLLSFGAIAQRTRYVLADSRVRAEIAAAVRMAGGVRTDSGHWFEVLR